MHCRRTAAGFSLVEVMVVIAILAVLLSIGAGSYSTYMTNQRILSATETFKITLMMARAEAVKLNDPVEVLRTNAEPVEANVNSATDSDDGVNVMVRRGTAGAFVFVEGRRGSEGGGSTPPVITGPSSITFDSLGTVSASTPAMGAGDRFVNFNFSLASAGACAADDGPIRCQRLRLARGGQLRQCDPAVDNTDTRFCGL